MLMLDLCAGLGGASAAMRDRAWDIVTVDNDPQFRPDVLADIRKWTWTGGKPSLIWASPPCIEFSRESMPWSRTGQCPDMTIVLACKRIIDEADPDWWVIENVRGAIRWFEPELGQFRMRWGPFFLWGRFPDLGQGPRTWRYKESLSSAEAAKRAKIPYQLSSRLADVIENSPLLF